MIAATSPILQMLNKKVDVLTLSPVERKLYESRMKLKSDIATISEVQFKSGLERGIAEGSHQNALETARRMKHANCELSFIAKMTGVSEKEIETLNQQITLAKEYFYEYNQALLSIDTDYI